MPDYIKVYEKMKKVPGTNKLRIYSEFKAIVYEIKNKRLSIYSRKHGTLKDYPLEDIPKLINEIQGICDTWGRVRT